MTTDEKAMQYALMSEHRQQQEDEREDRASFRQACAEIGVALFIVVVVLAIHGGIEVFTHVR